MHIAKIREAVYAQPFRPFKIHLADGGRIIPVQHLEFIALTHRGREIIVVLPDDSTQFIDVMLITRLEFEPSGPENIFSFKEDHSSKPMNERIRELRHAEPFRPFRIHLANGETVVVEYSEAVAVSPNGCHAVVMSRRSNRMIEIGSITRLEVQTDAGNDSK